MVAYGREDVDQRTVGASRDVCAVDDPLVTRHADAVVGCVRGRIDIELTAAATPHAGAHGHIDVDRRQVELLAATRAGRQQVETETQDADEKDGRPNARPGRSLHPECG